MGTVPTEVCVVRANNGTVTTHVVDMKPGVLFAADSTAIAEVVCPNSQ